jgi:hypothetical protein
MVLKNPYTPFVLAVFSGSIACFAAACGDEKSDPPPIEYGGGGSGGNTGGTGPGGNPAGGNGPVCNAPEPAHMGDSAMIDTIQAVLLDQNGDPAEGVLCTACGTNQCSMNFASQANGTVIVDGAGIDLDNPRFNISQSGRDYAKLTAIIPTAPAFDFGTARAIRIPALATGAAFTAGTDVVNSGVTLGIPMGANVKFEVEFGLPEDQKFVAAVVNLGDFDLAEFPSIPANLPFELLVATAPHGTKICPGAKLTADVSGFGLTANAEYDVYVNGNLTFDHYAPYGEWAKISEAVVSADAMTISTKDGMGIEVLGALGFLPK